MKTPGSLKILRHTRYGRILGMFIPMSLLLASALLPGCSGNDNGQLSPAAVAHQQEEARNLAVREARALAPEQIADSTVLMKSLIDVRIRERQLREQGRDDLADIYIQSFLSALDSINPALRAQLK